MKLKFVADAIYDGNLVFKKDQICEVSDELGFASRWIRRGIAIKLPQDDASPKQGVDLLSEQKQNTESHEAKKFKKTVKRNLSHEAL